MDLSTPYSLYFILEYIFYIENPDAEYINLLYSEASIPLSAGHIMVDPITHFSEYLIDPPPKY